MNEPGFDQPVEGCRGECHLRAVVLSIIAAAILLGVVMLLLRPYLAHKRAMEQITRLGGVFSRDGRCVAFLDVPLGDNELHELVPDLRAMPGLRILAFSGTNITDASVPDLETLRGSSGSGTLISLGETQLSKAGRARIQGVEIGAEEARRLLRMDGEESVKEMQRLIRENR